MSDHFHDGMTLGEARAKLRTLADDGHECPLCSLFVKVYRHKCDSAMARTLIIMSRKGWKHMHVPSLPGDNHKVSQLTWWGLVEEERVRRPDGGRAGWWRVTDTGHRFVHGGVDIVKYARIFDARVLGHDGELVSIQDCLGNKFNYQELMTGVAT